MKKLKFFLAVGLVMILNSPVLAQWTTSSGKTYTTNSVGIGTTNPLSPLHVIGNMSITGSISQSNQQNGFTMHLSGTYDKWHLSPYVNGGYKFDKGIIYHNTGQLDLGGNLTMPWGAKFAIGTRTPSAYNLHIHGNGYMTDKLILGAYADTLNLTRKLEVNGNIKSRGSISLGNESNHLTLHYSSDYTKWYFSPCINGTYEWGRRLVFHNTGQFDVNGNLIIMGTNKIGIGTTNPLSPLHVLGNLRITSKPSQTVSMIIGSETKGFHIHTQSAGDKLFFFTYANGSVDSSKEMVFHENGTLALKGNLILKGNNKIGVGIENPGTALDVNGVIRAHEVKVCLNQGCDFVFDKDYPLMSLNELDNFISKNKHLPEVAPAAVMESEGINVSEMNAMLLQKIEELTLYVIAQDKRTAELEKKIEQLEAEK